MAIQKERKIIKNLKKNEVIFTQANRNGYLTEDTQKNAIIEQEIKTYKIQNKRKKLILYELNRKQPPKKIQTFNKTKSMNKPEVLVSRLNQGKIRLKEKITYEHTNKEKGITYVNIQSNYKPKTKPRTKTMYGSQMIGLAVCNDERRNISATLLCHSKVNRVWTDSKIKRAMQQMYSSAYTKFIGLYGNPRKSSDIRIAIPKEYIRFKSWYQKD